MVFFMYRRGGTFEQEVLMNAALRHPTPMKNAPETEIFPGMQDRRDGPVLKAALIVAVVLHLAVILAPIKFSQPEAPAQPEVTPIILRPLDIPPPEIEPPRDIQTTQVEHRAILPADDPTIEELQPIEEDTAYDMSPDDDFIYDSAGLPVDPVPPPNQEVYQEGTAGLEMPVRLFGPQPTYPEVAIRAGIQGMVILRAIIHPDGSVEPIRVLRTPNPDIGFSEEAVRVISTWRYRPGVMHGRPVAVEMTVTIDFSLNR